MRDIEYRILTTLEDAALREGTRALEDLGTAGDDTARQLDDTARGFDQVGSSAEDMRRDLDRVDDGFDTVARASRTSASTVDRSTDDMRRSVRDVGSEAGDTAREMGASFSGGADDALDAFQELGANAGTAFGPVGVAAGVAASVGIGLIRAEAEKLKELARDLTQEMIDAGGRLTEAAISNRVQTMAAEDPGDFTRYNDAAVRLGISIRDVARARAGDAEAAERVRDAVGKLITKQREEADAAGDQIAQRKVNLGGLDGLLEELSTTSKAMEIASEAAGAAMTASAEESTTAIGTVNESWDTLRGSMYDPITGKVTVEAPSAQRLANIRYAMQQGIGPIVVDVYARPRYDQSTFSRYRP